MAAGIVNAAPPARFRDVWEKPPRRLLVVGADAATYGSWAQDVSVAAHEPFEFPDESFDAVLLATRRAFRPPHDGLLKEIQRVLRPGGRLIVDPPSAVRKAYVRRFASEVSHYFDAYQSHGLIVGRRRDAKDPSHFEQLAPDYWAQLPAHVTEHFLQRKTDFIERALPRPTAGLVGLEVGCGVGKYAQEVSRRLGVRLLAVDPARGNLREASATSGQDGKIGFAVGDALHLPFPHATFDFAYAINVLHHLKRGEQERALEEIRRVLKPGGVLALLEMNTRNPLFRWYLRHVYPKTRRIDRGDEEFIHPDRLPLIDGLQLERVEYSTFAPDFVPRFLWPAARAAEGLLERAFPRHAIHYAALLRVA